MLWKTNCIPLDKREAARYLGYGGKTPDIKILALMEKAAQDLKPAAKVWWIECGVEVKENRVCLGQLRFTSRALAKNLSGCKKAVLFGATLGIDFDRLLQKREITSPTEATVLQAVGTAAIETACDMFCETLGETRPRFSPGYGDLDIQCQKELFRVLDLPRKLGITLTESCLMVPTKSVTAIVGLGAGECAKGCAACTADCAFREQS